jgi:hypothetical protein
MRFEVAAGESIGTRDQRTRDRGSLSQMFHRSPDPTRHESGLHGCSTDSWLESTFACARFQLIRSKLKQFAIVE